MRKFIIFLICCIISGCSGYSPICRNSYAEEIEPQKKIEESIKDSNSIDSKKKVLDIMTFVPESDFDKDVHTAIKIMFKELSTLMFIHDKNMIKIGSDVDTIFKKLETINNRLIRLELRIIELENK